MFDDDYNDELTLTC